MTIRSLVFWPHLVAGVLAGLVILLMSVTGVFLTYERQMIAWSDREFRSVPTHAGQARLPIETLVARFSEAHPGVAPTAVTIGSAPDAPAAFAVPQRTLYADAYTGAALGEGSPTMRRVMADLRAWHRWIAVEGPGRPLARAITGWANLIFLFIVASGFYLWFPRKWTWNQVKTVTLFRGNLQGKARDFNWHNVIGVWSAVPLFIVVLSATPISFPWANALVYQLVGEPAPPTGGGAQPRAVQPAGRAAQPAERAAQPGGREGREDRPREAPTPDGLNALWTRAEQHVSGWRTINMRFPNRPEAPVVFAIDRGDGGQPHLRSTLTLDRLTGAVVSEESFSDLTLGRRIRNTMRFAHTGEVLGIPGQTIAGAVSAGGAVLVWTGLALAWRRLRAWLKRRGERPVAAPVIPRTQPVDILQLENQR